MNRPYIINDAEGNPINAKYPPDKELYGNEFNGYKNRTEEVLFYEFMVLEKDVSFIYNGTRYYFYKHNTPATAYNATKKEIIAQYPNEIELIESFSIDGIPFLELRDEICDLSTYRNVFKPHFDLDKDGYPYNCSIRQIKRNTVFRIMVTKALSRKLFIMILESRTMTYTLSIKAKSIMCLMSLIM